MDGSNHKSFYTDGLRPRQQTLKNAINCSGTGLHSGAAVSLTLLPAAPDTGIVFCRTDLAGEPQIPATWDYVVDSQLCTSLGDGNGLRIGTVEHLMAALSGCGVDNAIVEIDGPEVPIMDGSSAPFVFLIECAGVVEQDAPLRAIEVLKHVAVGDNERTASLTPGETFSVSIEIEFDETLIDRQAYFFDIGSNSFAGEIARARTFGFDHEIAALRSKGLARGGSLDNAIVVSGDRILNDGGLRYQDEFVRHKVLDSIGDLFLAGAPLIGHYHGFRSGHGLTHSVLRALFADASAWRYTTVDTTIQAVEPRSWASEPLAATA
ncbi:MAG: UDP-3-O-acyl-N-acetylglucosamine deacetylase [Alphaproteobacteria bacterium]|nr:UDP-3-O-acyl-N-acetylglucosamine deacetylase [Alphaproteobacteria bacterium]